MSGPFQVGDLVECIDASANAEASEGDVLLIQGELYTVTFTGRGWRKARDAMWRGVKVDKAPCGGHRGWPDEAFRLVRRPGDHADFLASLTRDKAPGLDVDGERRSEVATAMFHGDCIAVVRSLDTR